MRVLFHLRPPTGSRNRTLSYSRLCACVGVSIVGERRSGGAGGVTVRAARDFLTAYRVDYRADGVQTSSTNRRRRYEIR